MLSGRTLQISLSLCLLCFFMPWYWSSMKGRAGAHLRLNLILHRQKSKMVHVKTDRKELFLWETKLFTLCYYRTQFCWCNPCKTQRQTEQLQLVSKTNKRTTKSIWRLQQKFSAWIKITDMVAKKRKNTFNNCLCCISMHNNGTRIE